MTRWGILATGTIAHTFAQTIKAMDGEAQLYAVASRRHESARQFAQEFDIPVFYDSYEALANDPNVDIVYVATPHSRHFEDMEMLIRAGKPILCEKSFTTDAQQAEKIFRFAREKGVFIMEGFWTKFLPVYREVEKILSEGTIGEIRTVTAQYGYKTPRQERKFEAALAGGTLLDIGVYAVGFACMALGYSFGDVLSQLVMNEAGTDATDAVILRRGNAVAQLTCIIGAEMPTHAAIYGTKGRIDIPDFKNPQKATLFVDGQEPVEIRRPFEINGFEYEIRAAMECLREGKTQCPMMNAEHTVPVMRIMDEVRRQNGLRFPFERSED